MTAHAAELLQRALADDREALGELLRAYRPYVRVLVHAVRGGRPPGPIDDSDLIQDTLLEATRSFETFRGATLGEFVVWLRVLACRTALHTVRKAQAQAFPVELLASQAADDTGPSEALLRQEQAVRLARALENLPAEMRAVVLARHVDELSHAAIAEQRGSTPGAVRILYMRALRRLREELEHSDP
jgi:RNA polymerase sigma-70 factor (ECF subfamily)